MQEAQALIVGADEVVEVAEHHREAGNSEALRALATLFHESAIGDYLAALWLSSREESPRVSVAVPAWLYRELERAASANGTTVEAQAATELTWAFPRVDEVAP